MSLKQGVARMIDRSQEEQMPKEQTLFPCTLYAVDCRQKLLWLQNMDTGDLLQLPSAIPHQDVFRIPTSDRNYVWLLTMGYNHLQGVPFLYDRNYIEPSLFETVDPATEQA